MDKAHSTFRDAIRAAGLEPPEVIEPGEMHRFPGVGKQSRNRAGWCLLFNDGMGGCFGDWSTGFTEKWQATRERPATRFEHATLMRRVNGARARAEVERRARQSEASKRAAAIWKAAARAPGDHPYLIRKAVTPYRARIHKGALTLPVIDSATQLTSLQFIDANGTKRLLSGGRKRGCFIPVAGDMATVTRVIICEGWATGCTLAADEPAALVLAAIDAGNLASVALAARQQWPSSDLVVAGDDDRLTEGNPGATKARAAAIAADALLALPPWPNDAPKDLTDFNDLAVWLKRAAV